MGSRSSNNHHNKNNRLSNTSFIPVHDIFLLPIICALIKPYKNMLANASAVTLLALMASTILLFVSTPMNIWFSLITLSFLSCLPHCVFYGYLVCKLIKLMKEYCSSIHQTEEGENQQLQCRPASTTYQSIQE